MKAYVIFLAAAWIGSLVAEALCCAAGSILVEREIRALLVGVGFSMLLLELPEPLPSLLEFTILTGTWLSLKAGVADESELLA